MRKPFYIFQEMGSSSSHCEHQHTINFTNWLARATFVVSGQVFGLFRSCRNTLAHTCMVLIQLNIFGNLQDMENFNFERRCRGSLARNRGGAYWFCYVVGIINYYSLPPIQWHWLKLAAPPPSNQSMIG